MFKAFFSFLIVFLLSPSVFAEHESGYDMRRSTGQGQRVEIYDHGLLVPVNSVVIPPGWRINQHIATDINNVWRMFSSYVLDYYGPNGEVVTSLFPVAVYPSQGQNWEQVWWQLFDQRFGQSGSFAFGPTTQSPLSQRLFPNSNRVGIPVFERDIRGTLQGRQVEGKLFAQIADTGYSLIMFSSVFLNPPGQMNRTIETLSQITASTIENPQYQMRSRQIMAQRTQQHQAIMQSNQAWFDSHMASMRQASEMQSQSNREFSAYLRSGGSTGSSGNTYSTNDQYTDYLRDTTSFNDPYSGHRISQQGQYEYWYTDGLGNYRGTNDPNFDPSSLNGDWRGITLLEP